ncbi:MAG: monomeric [FeFe] hydrogenase [Bacteroidales bacterium]|jgi:[FeFe] hydrogenase (group B1/B3)|nr:monomeric [FeFe] hydrogenase [Bacteroidales bacterium]
MAYTQNTLIIRKELIASLADMVKRGTLEEEIDYLPIQRSPRHTKASRRCCIHKERAVTKYKLMPLLGHMPSDEDDELKPLSAYVEEAMAREEPSKNILTVVDEACTGCVEANYVVTNLCRGCVASPCVANCPKDAVSLQDNHQAKIDSSVCINCGICEKACPFHSIVYIPVPCEKACPVAAISKNEHGIEVIDYDKCIYCGKCITACPFGSIFEVSHMMDIWKSIKQEKQVVAIVAPAIMGQYRSDPGKIMAAVKAIGFTDVLEVARGAMDTSYHEARELKEKMEAGESLMTTSCCPAYTNLTYKHLKDLQAFVSHTGTPMHYSALRAKEQYPDAKVVFIGPCVAKREEATRDKGVDFVLTFEEIDGIFAGLGIDVEQMEPMAIDDSITFENRNYAVSGGVTNAVLAEGIELDYEMMKINGINKKNIALLRAASKGKTKAKFIEVMACEGGCIAGPSAHVAPEKSGRILAKNIDGL